MEILKTHTGIGIGFVVGDTYVLYQNEAQCHIITGNRVHTTQKGAYYIVVMNMTVMVRPWDVEDAMEPHSLFMHPYYLKKRVWKFLYPDTFLNVVSTIHFYQHADPQWYLLRAVELGGSVCDFLECEKKTSSSAELSYWLGVHYWHKGVMRQVVYALCEEAFDTLQVFSIYALVEKRNTASTHVLEVNGFQREESGKLHMFRRYKQDMCVVFFYRLYMRKRKRMKQCRQEDKERLNFQACNILFSCISPICEKLIESCASFCIYRSERNCKLVKNIEKYFKKRHILEIKSCITRRYMKGE